jgi:hypothetical protein
MKAIMCPVVIVLGIVLGYVFACAWFPFAACRKCQGAGNFRSSSGKAWRRCRRCRGSGERIRLGRKIWNYFAARRADAS